MSRKQSAKCVCGRERRRQQVVCSACWAAAPVDLRQAVLARQPHAMRRHAIGRLVTYAKSRAGNPWLPGL